VRTSPPGTFATRTGRYDVSEAPTQDGRNADGEAAPSPSSDGVAAPTSPDRVYVATKRGLDLVVVLAAAPVWLPLYTLIAVLIALLDGRPIHYRNPRVGRYGRPLALRKFRSMRRDADQHLADLLARDPTLREEFAKFQKLRSDPRVTRVGRALRRFSLDELPQLFHVLTGEMSLVGPRPLTQAEVDRFYGDQAEILLSVPPGLTGLWQVSGRSSLTLEERVLLDLRYIRERSLRLDCAIFLKTIPSVLRGHDAG
jgi:exopolysaccharide production protein ExoY